MADDESRVVVQVALPKEAELQQTEQIPAADVPTGGVGGRVGRRAAEAGGEAGRVVAEAEAAEQKAAAGRAAVELAAAKEELDEARADLARDERIFDEKMRQVMIRRHTCAFPTAYSCVSHGSTSWLHYLWRTRLANESVPWPLCVTETLLLQITALQKQVGQLSSQKTAAEADRDLAIAQAEATQAMASALATNDSDGGRSSSSGGGGGGGGLPTPDLPTDLASSLPRTLPPRQASSSRRPLTAASIANTPHSGRMLASMVEEVMRTATLRCHTSLPVMSILVDSSNRYLCQEDGVLMDDDGFSVADDLNYPANPPGVFASNGGRPP